ncbi:MAG: phage upper tail fiber protein [Azonexus sp.]
MALGNTPRRETNIAVEASKSYMLGVYFKTPDNTPVDLTNCVIRFVATDPPQRGASEVLSIVADMDTAEVGLVQFKFQAADLTLEPGSYAYDVTLYPPSGYSTPILKGYIEIGANTDLDDSNVYDAVNTVSDITAIIEGGDHVTVEIERVDGLYLVVTNLIEDFSVAMQAQVDVAAGHAQAALVSENEAEAANSEMQAWLDNAGFPFWKGTQAQYNALTPKYEILYLITDEAS